MKLSRFGHQLSADSGIVDLMKDLGEALNVNRDVLFLGGGNPATIPEFESYAARHAQGIASDPLAWHKLIGVYQSPKGSEEFIALLVSYINKQFGWGISEANVAITNGSQSAFFILLNMYAGQRVDSTADNKLAVTQRQIVFPMMPEYLAHLQWPKSKNLYKSIR
jgi:valine--pyruvate aminotransferase